MSRYGPRLPCMRSTLSALVLAAALALPASAARADLLDQAACETSELRQPFVAWADPAWYELAPRGDFEQPGWTLDGGAQRVPGSEPYAATGKVGNWSLRLPAGSSARSPLTCVDTQYPTVRFFIAGTGSVAVSVVHGGITIPAGVAVAGSSWSPSPVTVTTSPLLAIASGGSAQVSVRLSGVSGHSRVDDVFVDPWNRG